MPELRSNAVFASSDELAARVRDLLELLPVLLSGKELRVSRYPVHLSDSVSSDGHEICEQLANSLSDRVQGLTLS